VQSPAATRGGRDRTPLRLARAQRTEYYVSSDSEEEYDPTDADGRGRSTFDTVDRHLDIDDTDRVDSTSSDDESDSEDDEEELERYFYGEAGVVWANGELDAMISNVESLREHGAISRDGKDGFRVADEKAIQADARTLPNACKGTTLLGLLNAAAHPKFRKSAKSRDIIRREVENRFGEIMASAQKVVHWLTEDFESHTQLLHKYMTMMSGGDDVDATFLEPGPLGKFTIQ
jgi:hypothetical protein